MKIHRFIGWVLLCSGIFRLGMILGVYAAQVANAGKVALPVVSWQSAGIWIAAATTAVGARNLVPSRGEKN